MIEGNTIILFYLRVDSDNDQYFGANLKRVRGIVALNQEQIQVNPSTKWATQPLVGASEYMTFSFLGVCVEESVTLQ